MIGTEYVSMNFGRPDTLSREIGYEEVVQTPTDIPSPCPRAIAPPAILCFIRVQVAERVGIPCLQQGGELATFLVGKSGVASIGIRVTQIKRGCCNIKVATNYDGLF